MEVGHVWGTVRRKEVFSYPPPKFFLSLSAFFGGFLFLGLVSGFVVISHQKTLEVAFPGVWVTLHIHDIGVREE